LWQYGDRLCGLHVRLREQFGAMRLLEMRCSTLSRIVHSCYRAAGSLVTADSFEQKRF
jgi:hypothetical protein